MAWRPQASLPRPHAGAVPSAFCSLPPQGFYCPTPAELLPCASEGAYCPGAPERSAVEAQQEGRCPAAHFCPNVTAKLEVFVGFVGAGGEWLPLGQAVRVGSGKAVQPPQVSPRQSMGVRSKQESEGGRQRGHLTNICCFHMVLLCFADQ